MIDNRTIRQSLEPQFNRIFDKHLKSSKTPDPKIIYNHLINRQSFNRWYNGETLHKDHRIKVLFGTVQNSARILEMHPETFCLSVHIFDSVISKFPIEKNLMLPLGLVALQLAAKVNGKRPHQISYRDLDMYIFRFGVEQYSEMEKWVLAHLNFRINVVTPMTFMYFLLYEFLKTDYLFFGTQIEIKENCVGFMSLCRCLHLITLIEYEFYCFTSLAVAVSIIIVGRQIWGLNPWTSKMIQFSRIKIRHVEKCIAFLKQKLKGHFVWRSLFACDKGHRPSLWTSPKKSLNGNSGCILQISQQYTLNEKYFEQRKFMECPSELNELNI